MLRAVARKGALTLVAAGLLAAPGQAQYRGEEIVGVITEVDNMTVTVQREGAPDVRVKVSARTEVVFTDSGDRRLFPNPSVDDLRAGMGVRFVYGTGSLDRIQVHYVPAVARPQPTPRPRAAKAEKIKARIEAVSRDRRRMTADVAGRSETFLIERASVVSRFRAGDLVVLTVEDRGAEGMVVTRIDSADLVGTVTRVDSRRDSISIEVDGRDETYRVDDRNLLRGIREGDRVRFEVEERSRGKVITALERR